jgi:beta-phosphoglucomutase
VIKACIFDLDGVIVDTAHYHFLAWRRLARELGADLTEEQNERLKGVSRMQSLEIILGIGHIQLTPERKEEMATKKNSWFVDYVEQMKPEEIFPGVALLLGQLREKRIKIALASSSKNAKRVIELLKIGSLFDAIVDGTMTVNSKPDPEIFLLAAKNLNVSVSECLVFEDAESGVEAALRAGMKCVGVGSPAQLGKANKVITRTGDFQLSWLDSL